MPRSSAKYINPWRYADAGTAVKGELAISRMVRLATLLGSDSGAATYELSFALDEGASPVVTGRVAAVVEVICQRCLEPMAFKIASEIRLGIVRSEEAEASVPTDLEPVMVENDQLSLAALVEDELILAFPSAPLHPAGECRPPGHLRVGEAAAGAPANRPFAALSKLRSRTGRQGS